MASPQRYILHVTAGPSRDRSGNTSTTTTGAIGGTGTGAAKAHQTVPVNTSEPVVVETERVEAKVWVRIRGYRGLPRGSPETAPYFEHPKHRDDRYSIQFNFRLKEGDSSTSIPSASTGAKEKDSGNEGKGRNGDDSTIAEKPITGDDILLGNDFDHPIRDKLPPGFSTAFRIVKWFIDPGLDGDVDADEPYLYGPLLSSINALEFGNVAGDTTGEDGAKKEKETEEIDSGDSRSNKGQIRVLEENGLDGDSELRGKLHIPSDSKARMKYFLNVDRRKEFIFEKGREYRCDFYNPYLDFNEFALRLPGFTLNIMRYWDGQPLRYVLKNRSSGEVYFVVTFNLLPVNENGELLSPSGTIGLIGTSDDGPINKESDHPQSSSVEAASTVANATAPAPSTSGLPIDDQGVD